MELYQLRTFQVVAEAAHLTKAAKKLNASQPAVSAHIKNLEQELGIELFLRTPKGMVITDAGRQLMDYAELILKTSQDMASHARRLHECICGNLKIGLNTAPDSLKIAGLYATMREKYPKLQIHFLRSTTAEIEENLEDGYIDAGFIYGNDVSEKLFSQEVQQLSLFVTGPQEWADRLEKASVEQLGHMPWIVTASDCPFHAIATDFFKRNKLNPPHLALSDSETAIRSMVRAGVGLALLTEKDISENGKTALAVWPQERFPMPISLACLQRRKNEQIMQALFAIVTDFYLQ